MAQIRCKELQKLYLQAKFSPEKQRKMQINACDTLLRLVRPGKAYPFEFVCFHLTGYRPRTSDATKLIDYNTLLHDLSVYTEQISRSMKIPVGDLAGQKFFTVQSLCRRFEVCPKTISRWRRKGLAGRYLLFADGKYRLAFLAGTVDLFARRQRRQVRRGKSFSQMTAQERNEIIGRLERMGQFCPDRRQEALRRTAQKFGRSVETVRMILVEHEKNISDRQLFAKRLTFLDEHQQREITELFEQSVSIKELMRRFGRSKSNVYRAINLHRAAQLEGMVIEYMPCEEFDLANTKEHILKTPADLFALESKTRTTAVSNGKKTDLESYVAEISRTNLLTGRQERFLFRKYNYLKYLAANLQSLIEIKHPQGRLISQMRSYLHEADEVKDRLIGSNLRLVVSAARKHTRNETEMMELVSEGNMALLRAVEKFDFSRGFKLSTYATWAIFKRFASFRQEQGRRTVTGREEELLETTSDLRREESQLPALEAARKSLHEVMEETLEKREKVIVQEHYGLTAKEKAPGRRKARSLRQIAARVGLSKERVRQIELVALQKLRKVLTPEQFEVLTQS